MTPILSKITPHLERWQSDPLALREPDNRALRIKTSEVLSHRRRNSLDLALPA